MRGRGGAGWGPRKRGCWPGHNHAGAATSGSLQTCEKHTSAALEPPRLGTSLQQPEKTMTAPAQNESRVFRLAQGRAIAPSSTRRREAPRSRRGRPRFRKRVLPPAPEPRAASQLSTPPAGVRLSRPCPASCGVSAGIQNAASGSSLFLLAVESDAFGAILPRIFVRLQEDANVRGGVYATSFPGRPSLCSILPLVIQLLSSWLQQGCSCSGHQIHIPGRKKKGLCQLRPVDFLLHQVATLSCKGVQ